MTIRIRMEMFCECFDICRGVYPKDGPVDGAIYTLPMLRNKAKKHGWKRVHQTDYCPDCAARAKAEDERV